MKISVGKPKRPQRDMRGNYYPPSGGSKSYADVNGVLWPNQIHIALGEFIEEPDTTLELWFLTC
jgi:hypothetical protein